MPTLETMKVVISIAGVLAAIGTFIVYFVFTLGGMKPDSQSEAEEGSKQARATAANLPAGPTAGQVADIIKAFATLSTNLLKAGPALYSMIGSALFLLIAAIAAGAIVGGSSSGNSSTESNASAPQDDAANASNASNSVDDENLKVK